MEVAGHVVVSHAGSAAVWVLADGTGSCQPNTGVVDNSQDGYDFVALQEIQPGDELTWDYETIEYVSIAVPR